MSAATESPRRSSWFFYLLGEFSVSHIGHFAVMAILSLYLLDTLKFSAPQAAALMLFSALSFRLMRIFIAPFVDHLPTRRVIVVSLAVCCVGYVGLAFSNFTGVGLSGWLLQSGSLYRLFWILAVIALVTTFVPTVLQRGGARRLAPTPLEEQA